MVEDLGFDLSTEFGEDEDVVGFCEFVVEEIVERTVAVGFKEKSWIGEISWLSVPAEFSLGPERVDW